MKWFRQCTGSVLRAGPIPAHIAFIMDGNRRYADRLEAEDRAVGHKQGFLKLLEALEWCLELGVQCVSVYAFSIENFRRSPEEVATLMHLAETKLKEISEEHALVERYGIQVRVIGDLSLLPPAVQAAAVKVMGATKTHSRAILNICLAYTSTQEMANALANVQRDIGLNNSHPVEVGADLFEQYMYTKGCPPVELLVRTSGESRLSDFLLRQSSHALLHFTPVLWPNFSFLDLLRALLAFQQAAPDLQKLKQARNSSTAADSEDLTLSKKRKNGSQKDRVDGDQCNSGADNGGARGATTDNTISTGTGVQARGREVGEGVIHQSLNIDGPVSGDIRTQGTQVSSFPDTGVQKRPSISSGNARLLPAALASVPARRNARIGVDRRKESTKQPLLDKSQLDELGLFKVSQTAAERALDLRAAGFAGGYDSLEDDEDDSTAHINGCPCCIVKFLPMHRICRDPTPSVALLRNERGSSNNG